MEAMAERWSDVSLAADVLAVVEKDLEALDPDRLLAINVEIEQAARSVLHALPAVKLVREEITLSLPAFNWSRFDKLEAYVWVLRAAQASLRMQPVPDGVRELTIECCNSRARLLVQANAFVALGVLDARRLLMVKGRPNHDQVLEDLRILTSELNGCWEQLSHRPEAAARDLNDAIWLEGRLRESLLARDRAESLHRAASVRRRLAFTLVIMTYEEIRLAVAYVRRSAGDAESIAPSLFGSKSPPIRERASERARRRPAPDRREP
ncbi:MAG: hypothetical protein ABW061_00720 [Polyangiaceae bacterium]